MVTRIGPKSLKPRKIYLREWRDYRQLTQEQLADRMNTTKATVSRIENLHRDPQLAFLEAAAEALNCTSADILSRDPYQPSQDKILEFLSEPQRKQVIDYAEFVRKSGTDG